MFIDPVTRKRIVTAKHVGDIVYDLSGDDAISQENVPLIGPWEDYTGSDPNVQSRELQMWAGHENKFWGQVPKIESNEDLSNLSVVGTRKGTHRRRPIKKYKKLDG